MLRAVAIALASLLLVGALLWWWIGGSAGVVASALPAFPDWPAPAERLAADSAGHLHFETLTPYDFDVVLAGLEDALPTTGVGTLVLPDGASPETPAPAVVVLHGSGGLKPGRELGVEVEAHVFEGAGHAWENDEPRVLVEEAPFIAGCEVHYDEAGWPSVDGTPLARLEAGSSRPERIAARVTHGRPLGACVRHGYVVGSDPETKRLARERQLGFLRRTLVR